MSVLLSLALRALLAAAPAAPVAPDVVLIVADDLGFADVGWNGSEIATPRLDRLAAEGVVLDRFYVPPLCSPSRAALLTGRYPVAAGISEPVTHTDTTGLGPGVATLADALRAGGYQTAMVGKWHLGTACPHHPLRHGFDAFVGMLGGGADYYTRVNGRWPDWWRGYAPERPDGYTTDLVAAEAVAALTRPRERPLFLYLPFTAPHSPLQAPPDDVARYAALSEPRRTYAAMVTALDRAVGQVMDAVEATGRPTVVWFLSDNGGVERHGGRNRPLRGEKGQVYEGALRVPSVVWYPPWGARTVTAPVWALDVAPTLAALAGAPAGATDGADVGPVLAGGPVPDALLDRVLFSYRRAGGNSEWLSAQSARWKLVLRTVFGDVRREELYRVDLDPTEAADSARAYPERVAALRAAARAYADRTPRGAAHDVTLTELQRPTPERCGPGADQPAVPGPGGRWMAVSPNPSARPVLRVGGLPADRVRIDVVDARGRVVARLHDGPVGPVWAGEVGPGLAAGAYTAVLTEAAGTTAVPFTVVR